MANRRITDLPAISSASINDDDLLMVVDIAEVDPGLKNKKLTFTDTKQYFNGYYLQLTGGTVAGSLIVANDLTVSGTFTPNTINIIGTGIFSDLLVSGSAEVRNTFSGFIITGNTIQGLNVNATTGNVGNLTANNATVGTGNFTRISGTTITGTTGVFGSLSGQTITGATGLFSSLSGTNITGVNGVFTTQVSGSIVTGNTARFSTLTGVSGVFNTQISGAIVTGNFVNASSITGISGVFTTQLSGATLTGNTGRFTNLTGISGTFTSSVSGLTVTGATGLFTTVTGSLGTFTTTLSGATITGDIARLGTVTGISGVFTTQLSGAAITGDSGRFTSVTGQTGIFTSSLSGATITGVSGLFQRIEALTGVFTSSISIPSINTTGNIVAAGNLIVSGSGTISSGLVVSGTISGATITGITGTFGDLTASQIYGTTSISGVTITGASGNFGRVAAPTGIFTTTLSGSTITGNVINATTGNFVNGNFTVLSGATITGSTAQITNLTGVSGTFTDRISGALITGNAGQFANITGVSGVFTTRISGATVTGDTGQFANLTGVSGTFTNQVSGAVVTGNAGQFSSITGISGVFTTQVSGAVVTGVTGLFNRVTGVTGVFTSLVSGFNIAGENATFNYVTGNTRVEGANISGDSITGNTINVSTTTGITGVFTQYLSGATITGSTGNFVTVNATTVTAITGNFTIANFTETTTGNVIAGGSGIFGSGVFTSGTVSGAIITGNTAGFTTVTGTTVTGTTANFVSGVFTTRVSGVTITGTTANFTSGNFISLSGTTTTVTSGVFSAGSATAPSVAVGTGTTYAPGIYSPGTDQLAISTNGTGRLFVDTSGSISINTAQVNTDSPLTLLGFSVQGLTIRRFGSSNGTGLYTTAAAGTESSPTALGGVTTGVWEGAGYDGTTYRSTCKIILNSEGTITSTSSPGYITFNTTSPSSTSATEKMRLDSSGRLGLGTSSQGTNPDRAYIFAGGTDKYGLHLSMNNVTASGSANTAALRIDGQQGRGQGVYYGISVDISERDVGTCYGTYSKATGTYSTQYAVYADLSKNLAAFTNGYCYYANLSTTNSGGAAYFHYCYNSTSSAVRFSVQDSGQLVINSAGSTAPAIFQINANEAARIDSSGRLLVGTSSARTFVGGAIYQPFQVEGANNNNARGAALTYGINNTAGPLLSLAKHRSNSVGGSSVVASGDELGGILFQGADGTNLIQGASIYAYVDTTPGASDMPGRLVFSTTADGAATPTERVRIDNAGRVLVGTSTANTSGAKLQTSDGITFPATQVASADPNTLDDYEEGTHIATLTPSGSGSITLNATYQTLAYTKVGRLVSIRGTLIASSSSSPVGYVTVSLPFTPAAVSGIGYAGGSVFVDSATGVNANQFVLMVTAGGARIYLGDGTALQADSAQAIASAGQIYLEMNYHVA